MTIDFDYISGERKSFIQFCNLIIIYMGRRKHVSTCFANFQSFVDTKFGLQVFIGYWGICVFVIVTSEMTFDSGEVCCYMGSENKTKRL